MRQIMLYQFRQKISLRAGGSLLKGFFYVWKVPMLRTAHNTPYRINQLFQGIIYQTQSAT